MRTSHPLRSLKLCTVRLLEVDGKSVWIKTRLARSRFIVPAGNFMLALLGIGYRVCNSNWTHEETHRFRTAYPDLDEPSIMSKNAICLPNLPGNPLQTCESFDPGKLFIELNRYHSLGFVHGDPHLRNYLFDAVSNRYQLIDFETMEAGRLENGQISDYCILVLDLITQAGISTNVLFDVITDILPKFMAEAVIRHLRYPPPGTRLYWRLLGYPKI